MMMMIMMIAKIAKICLSYSEAFLEIPKKK